VYIKDKEKYKIVQSVWKHMQAIHMSGFFMEQDQTRNCELVTGLNLEK
jgi:hypothetical protein